MRQSYDAVEPSQEVKANIERDQTPKSQGVARWIAAGISVTVLLFLVFGKPNPPKQLYSSKTEAWTAPNMYQGIIPETQSKKLNK